MIWLKGDVAVYPPNNEESTQNVHTDDAYNLNYTEEEFIKEFQNEVEDDEKLFENDPRCF